ncbi:MAG: response regulator [Crocinitomicaceae bacterium]|nr:response regulator [Crocinitomicaceae bacterium]MCF8411677.1 response regulator [Crocinitomicaceae bacterium]MCF8444250.1 response regulator [Crocinitomicaceae bacterium]
MNELKYAVVCVDDDPYILQMLGFQLSKVIDQKFTLLEYFTDPNKALEGIGDLMNEHIDVIFVMVDYQMPKMTGAQLIRSLKLKYPTLNCVMLSGQANQVSVDELKSENLLASFISKPWDEVALFAAIRPMIQEHS